MPSPIAKKISGTYISDSLRPLTSLNGWAQEECRHGSFRGIIDRFAATQEEPIDPSLALVEKVENDGILVRIPCKVLDHESPHAFQSDVWLKINPLVREIVRVQATA